MTKRHYQNFDFISNTSSEYKETLPSSKSTLLGASRARLGRLSTPHGVIETPNFIFCGTKATVKAIPSHQLEELGTQIILVNTYHLMIQPGSKLISAQKGIHRFMNWSGPMLSDSGGYQIFAMGHESVSREIKKTQQRLKKSLLKVEEEGASFRSYLNGDKIFLSPEISIQVQRELGADLIVQLDECTPFHIDKKKTESSMHVSIRWGKRSLKEFQKKDDGKQAIYGVVQGGIYSDLRKVSVDEVLECDFFGVAIGGSLGQDRQQMKEVVSLTTNHLYQGFKQSGNKPIHLLGIGRVADVFYGVRQGIDTFDCVHPTRIARHGWAIIPASTNQSSTSQINLHNSRFKNDEQSLDPSLISLTSFPPTHSTNIDNDERANNTIKSSLDGLIYSRAYLHHLLKAGEITGLTILSRHNIFQMNRLMHDIRRGIKEDCLDEVERYWCGQVNL